MQYNNHLLFIVSNTNEQAEFKTINLGDAWPACANKMVLKKGQSYSIFKQEMPESCSEYEREILKQTMLRHEEIFREQVHELHRLYKVQKCLMDDLKKKDLNTSTLSSTIKQDGAHMFHFGPEQLKSKEKQNLWDILNGSLIERDSAGHKYPPLGTHIPVYGQMEQNLQIASNPKEINGISKDFNKLQPSRALHRTFDLERPADEYIDDEATGQIEENTILRTTSNNNGKNSKAFNFHSSQEPENEVQLTLSTGWDKGIKINGGQTGPHLDLGVPKQEKEEMKESNWSRSNEETVHFSAASTRSEAATREILGNQKSAPSNQSFLGGMLGYGQESQEHEDHKSKWQKLDDEHEKSRKEKLPLDIEAGERTTQENPKQPHWIFQGQRSSMGII